MCSGQMEQLRCMRIAAMGFTRKGSRVCWRRMHTLAVQD